MRPRITDATERQPALPPVAGWIHRLLGVTSLVFGLVAWAAAADQPGAIPFERLGVESCQGCHQQPSELYREKRTTDFVSLTEFAVWSRDDKHAQAYKLLETDLGQRICKALQIDLQDGTSSQQCLSCHADWRKGTSRPKPFDVRQGVTCEACHGPASNWANPTLHQQEEWRRVSPDEKFKKHGMIDIRDPITRARVCNSCHIGDRDQGKFITHEMYAAGHPPLPPIEPESFADQMPRHWRLLIEKPDFEHRPAYEQVNRFRSGEASRSRGAMLGGVEALRSSIRQLAGEVTQAKGPSPDFAVFDCAACHHELTSNSWRLERGYGGNPPGRPPAAAWPTVLVPLAIRHAAADDAEFNKRHAEFRVKLKTLQTAIASRPFGDPPGVAAAAAELDAWLESLTTSAATKPVDTPSIQESLRWLSESEFVTLADFDSARQLSWAAAIFAVDLRLAIPSRLPLDPSAIDALRSSEQKRRDFVNDAFRGSKLVDGLRLKLPAGRGESIAAELPVLLRTQAEFDPAWFPPALRETIRTVTVK
jgi:hypothetical protein